MSDDFVTKVDVLDLVINGLREHEEKVDSLVGRLEDAILVLESKVDGTEIEE